MDKNIKEQIIELQRQQLELNKLDREKRLQQYKKNKEYRDKKALKDAEEAPRKIELLNNTLKVGNIIRCKGYNGEKQVYLIRDNKVFAMCGYVHIKTNTFIPNGSGSETAIENVTEIYDDKWIKIKDLLKN